MSVTGERDQASAGRLEAIRAFYEFASLSRARRHA